MNLIFAGTPHFARSALDALIAAGHSVSLVLTQPDRPAGRGMKLQPSPVKQAALAHGIALAQPRSLRLDGKYPEDAAAAQAAIAAAGADVMVVAAYGLLLPQWVLDAPRRGCWNIHASLLPRWRGAAPIHRAIEAGDAQTGVTIMQMDAGLDTGDMLLKRACPIAPEDNTASLHERLASLGAQAIVHALVDPEALRRLPQPSKGVTYAHKIDKAEAAIDWSESAEVIARRIRALDPAPGASTHCGDEVIKLFGAEVCTEVCAEVGYQIDSCSRNVDAACGQILSVNTDGIRIACGQGVLRVSVLQRAGGKRLGAADFLRGFPLMPGQVLGQVSAQVSGQVLPQ